MPIRFNCPHCARRLAAARRKGGTEVRCPLCGLPATVPAGPAADGVAAVEPPPAADRPLFETADVDALLGPSRPAFEVVGAAPNRPAPLSANEASGTPALGRTTAVWLAVAAVGTVVLAFVIGLKVGAAW